MKTTKGKADIYVFSKMVLTGTEINFVGMEQFFVPSHKF